MADDATLIFFRSGRGDLDTAAAALADRGMSVQRVSREFGDELVVGYSGGPQLRVPFVREPYVQQEAAEFSEGTACETEMGRCEARYEILIDNLDEVLDEINTLIEVQITLQVATAGFMLNSWNGELVGPDDKPA